ncbi:MAG: MlaD family protein [Candidatus Omnitrophota bacterium]
MKKIINNEIKIGIMVFVCIAALLILTVKVGSFSLGKKSYEINVQFQNISGIEQFAPVRLNGLEVGSVNDIQLVYDDATNILLTLSIDEGVNIREGAKAYVKTLGLIGEKYVGLKDTGEGEFLAPYSLIVGEEPVDFEELLAKGDGIADNLESATKNLDEFSDDIKRHPWKLLFRSKDKKK